MKGRRRLIVCKVQNDVTTFASTNNQICGEQEPWYGFGPAAKTIKVSGEMWQTSTHPHI